MNVLMWLGAVGAAGAGIVFVLAVIRWFYRLYRRAERFLDDWNGEPERPGVPARPGVMARLAGLDKRLSVVEHEMRPNSGESIKDAVTRIDQRTAGR